MTVEHKNDKLKEFGIVYLYICTEREREQRESCIVEEQTLFPVVGLPSKTLSLLFYLRYTDFSENTSDSCSSNFVDLFVSLSSVLSAGCSQA